MKVFTEAATAPQSVAGFADSIAMDVVESGARFGAAAGLATSGGGAGASAGAAGSGSAAEARPRERRPADSARRPSSAAWRSPASRRRPREAAVVVEAAAVAAARPGRIIRLMERHRRAEHLDELHGAGSFGDRDLHPLATVHGHGRRIRELQLLRGRVDHELHDQRLELHRLRNRDQDPRGRARIFASTGALALEVTLERAVETTLTGQRALRSAQFAAQGEQLGVQTARSAFDLKILPTGSVGHINDSAVTTATGNNSSIGVQFSKSFESTGTQISLGPSYNRSGSDTNTTLTLHIQQPSCGDGIPR
jgi:hypothetical protein